MAILLDGVDDFVNVPDSNSLSFGDGSNDSPFSISTWFFLDTNVDRHGLVGKGGGGFFEYNLWLVGTTGKLSFYLYNSDASAVEFITGSVVSLNQWHHVLATYDGRGGPTATFGLELYIDGALDSITRGGSGSYVAMSNTASPFYIGAAQQSPLYYFGGQMNETAIWGVELGLSDAVQLYKSKIKRMPLYIQPANLKGYCPMDDGLDGTSADGATVRDGSGNGNNGTGDDGANNTGCTWKAEEVLSYPPDTNRYFLDVIITITVDAGIDKAAERGQPFKPFSDATFSVNMGAITRAWYDIEESGDIEILKGSFSTLQDAVQAFEYTFNNAGNVTAQLKVQSNGLNQSTDSLTVTVDNPYGSVQAGNLKIGDYFRDPRKANRIYQVRKKTTPTYVQGWLINPQTRADKKNSFLILKWADTVERVSI